MTTAHTVLSIGMPSGLSATHGPLPNVSRPARMHTTDLEREFEGRSYNDLCSNWIQNHNDFIANGTKDRF